MMGMGNGLKRRSALLLLLLWFVIVATFYNVSLPLFEAPDEYDHFRFVHWLVTERRLPNLNSDLGVAGHEIWQPPLYYALTAIVVTNIDMTDLQEVAWFNTSYLDGASINVFFHTDAEKFPYNNATLAVHVARFVSTLIGCTAILSTYGLARLIAPKMAFLAAALLAFNPQFLFISAAVTNDIMTAALGGLAIWYLVWLILSPKQGIWHYAVLGLLYGLLTLAKLSGLAFGGVIFVGLSIMTWQRRSWRPFLVGGTVTAVTAFMVCSWWFWRNLMNYGDLLAWDEMLKTVAPLIREKTLSWVEIIQYAAFLRKSYWGLFGHGVYAPNIFYWFVTILTTVSGLGLFIWLVKYGFRQKNRLKTPAVFLLIIWSGVVFLSLLRWMQLLEATNQGRLLFPAITSLTVLQMLGLVTLWQKHRWLPKMLVAILGIWAALLPAISIQPAYAHPKTLADPGAIPNPVRVEFGSSIELLGFELVTPIIKPGESLAVDLYWQATETIDQNYRFALSLLDASGQLVARADEIPYDGRYATAVWQPGKPFRDAYTLSPTNIEAVPGQATLLLTLHPWGEPGQPLPVVVNDLPVGSMLTVLQLKIAPSIPASYQPSQPTQAIFGQQAVLYGFDALQTIGTAQPIEIALYWEALNTGGQDYNIFVHLLDENGELVAQADGPPQNGRYPTSIWETGEEIKDIRRIMLPEEIPPGQYLVAIGMYDLETGQRLPATLADGTAAENNRVELLTLQVR